MKECAYCGGKNEDDAVRCSGCGTDEFKTDAPVELPKLDEPEEFVTVFSCQRLTDADLIVGRLEAAGIETFVPDEFLMQTTGFNLNSYGYVRVQVHRKDYASARELCAMAVEPEEKPADGKNSVSVSEAEDATEAGQNRRQCVACNAMMPEKTRLCPKCGWTQPGY
jgi:RNA polymerase subunit RPABC4/transcription elongation factor Spt4